MDRTSCLHLNPGERDKSKSRSKSKGTGTQNAAADARTLLVSAGQPVEDMQRYVRGPAHTRLALACASLRWRHVAPTAPDTLWCHPFFAKDPFVIPQTPDIYVVGNQPAFATKLVSDDGSADGEEGAPKRCRIVLVPNFRQSGVLVLVNMRTLGVRRVQFAVEGMGAGGGET